MPEQDDAWRNLLLSEIRDLRGEVRDLREAFYDFKEQVIREAGEKQGASRVTTAGIALAVSSAAQLFPIFFKK